MTSEYCMKILLVDDEPVALEAMTRNLRKVLGEEALILTAENGQDALNLLKKTSVSVVFMDIVMPGMNGLDAARTIKKLYPTTNVIICTAHEHYAFRAWDLFISGYLLKPVSVERLKIALDHLRTPVVERLTVNCFGSFEVFFRGDVVTFPRRGAKELFAYLVNCCGKGVSSGELCDVLRDEPVNPELKKASVRKYVMALRKTFSGLGLDDVVCHTRDNYYVNTKRLDCDLYRFLEGDDSARKLYAGEFMTQYSWAENTIGILENMAM